MRVPMYLIYLLFVSGVILANLAFHLGTNSVLRCEDYAYEKVKDVSLGLENEQ